MLGCKKFLTKCGKSKNNIYALMFSFILFIQEGILICIVRLESVDLHGQLQVLKSLT